MSADDFQTKYSSVMESMLKSAVSETTKLFETMVDELKAEISKLKKENEDLRTKYDRAQKEKLQDAGNARTRESLRGPSGGLERRDTATQCDDLPVRTVVVEQCEPIRDLSLQSQKEQWLYEDMNYGLQEHDYVSHSIADSQMAHTQVKQEAADEVSLQSVLKQEDDEGPILACGQVVCDKGSWPVSPCGTEKRGLHINQEFSSENTSLPHKVEETVALGMTGPLVQNQSPELVCSKVISLATIKGNLEEEADTNIKISECRTQAEIRTAEHSLVVAPQTSEKEQHSQREDEMSVKEKPDAMVHHVEQHLAHIPCDQDTADESLKYSTVEDKTSPERKCERRGQLPRGVKILQLPTTTDVHMMKTRPSRSREGSVSSVVASGSPRVSSTKSKEISSIINRAVQQKPNLASANVDNQEVESMSVSEISVKKVSSTNDEKTPEPQRHSMEITEAEIHPPPKKVLFATEANTPQTPSLESSHHCTSVTIQDAMLLVEAINQSTVDNALPLCDPPGELQTVNETPIKSPLPWLPVLLGTQPVTALSALKLSKGVKLKAPPKTRDTTLNTNVQFQLKGVRPDPHHVVAPSSTSSSPVLLSKTANQSSSGLHQKHTPDPLSVSPCNLSYAATKRVIVLQKAPSLMMPHKITALASNQLSTVVTTVVHNTGVHTASTVASSFSEAPSLSCVPPKTIFVTTESLLPIVSSKSSVTLGDKQGGSLANSKIRIKAPRPSQTFVLATEQDTATPASSGVTQMDSTAVVSHLNSSSQEQKGSLSTQTTSPKEVTSTHNDTSDNLESPKRTTIVPETTNVLLETCSTSNRPLGQAVLSAFPVKQPTVEQNLSATVRLTRLPFPVSTKESVLLSKVNIDRTSGPRSKLKDTEAFEAPEIFTNVPPGLTETSFNVPVDTSNEYAPAASEMSNTVRDSQGCSGLHHLTTASVLAPAVDVTNPSDVPFPKQYKDKLSNTTQQCTSAASIQLTAFTSKDTSYPHLQMTKTQFLAQLAVSPRADDPEKVSLNVLPHSTVCCKKRFDRTSRVAHLRSHLKAHVPKRRPTVNTELCMDTETSTVGPKKRGLEIGNVSESLILGTNNGAVEVDVDCLNNNTNEPSPISPVMIIQSEECVPPKRSLGEQNTASSNENKHTTRPKTRRSTTTDSSNPKTTKPISQSPRRSSTTTDGSTPKNTKSTSESPRRSSTTADGSTPKNTKFTSQSPRRSSTKDCSSPENTKPTSRSPRRSSTTIDSSSPKNTKSTSQSPRRSSTTADGSTPKNTKFTSQSPRRSSTKDCSSPENTKPTSRSPGRSSTTIDSSSPKNTKSTSQSPRRSSTTIDSSSPKNTKSTSQSPRRSSTTADGSTPKNTKFTSQSPRRSSTIDCSSPENTKPTSRSRRRSSTTIDSSSPKNTKSSRKRNCSGEIFKSTKISKSTSVSPKSRRSTNDDASLKITNSRINSTRGCSSQKAKTESVSPRMSKSTWESAIVDNLRSFTKGNASTHKNKRKLNYFRPRTFTVTTGDTSSKKTKTETASPSIRSLGKHSLSPTRTSKSTPTKSELKSEGVSGSKTNLRMLNAKKLAKAAKAKTIAKMKNPQPQKVLNESKVTALQANCEAVKKITCKGVWIPPKMPLTETPREETKSKDVVAVYPVNNSVHPIPVKAPPMVSPLQPLMVIGGHLLKNQCGECGRMLSSSTALESHVRLHKGRRPFSCTLCGKSFPDSKGLKRHGRVHRNGRIHVCSQCGKGFVYRYGLTKHLQMVHGRIKAFVCQICNKGFHTKRDVESHILIHTGEKPFHCNLCEKKFARRVELNVHLRWHNGEKRHWCPYCGKGFLDYNNLKRHKFIHTGEKPHSCPHCLKCFTQSGHLKKHVKNVHKIK